MRRSQVRTASHSGNIEEEGVTVRTANNSEDIEERSQMRTASNSRGGGGGGHR